MHGGFVVTTPEKYNQIASQAHADTIADAIEVVVEYLEDEMENSWTGVFRFVVISNPADGQFSIEFFYNMMVFGDYTESDVDELMNAIKDEFDELDLISEESRFSFDFRIGKAFTT